jgi:protein arginine kinase
MKRIGTIHGDGVEWLETDGPFADIVLSTRVRLARNLRDFRFGLRANASDRAEILSRASQAAQ